MEKELDMDDILPEDVEMITKNIKRAVKLYKDKSTLKEMQVAAMKAAKEFSWVKATKQYIDHFLVSLKFISNHGRPIRTKLLSFFSAEPGSCASTLGRSSWRDPSP